MSIAGKEDFCGKTRLLGLAKSFLCMRNRRKKQFLPCKGIFLSGQDEKMFLARLPGHAGQFLLRRKAQSDSSSMRDGPADLMFSPDLPPIVRAARGRTGCPRPLPEWQQHSFQAVRKADPERVPAHRTAATRSFSSMKNDEKGLEQWYAVQQKSSIRLIAGIQAAKRNGFLRGRREKGLGLFSPDKPKFGIKVQHSVVGKQIHSITAIRPGLQHRFHQKTGKPHAAVFRMGHDSTQLKIGAGAGRRAERKSG